jgi:hypothetical protein
MFQGEDLAGHTYYHRNAVHLCRDPGDPLLHCKDENCRSPFGPEACGRADYTLNPQKTGGVRLLGCHGTGQARRGKWRIGIGG